MKKYKRAVHLVCNSHLDPVWLWEWPEGAAEALAMARTAVELCDEFDGFIFNRNEAMFYEWIEEYAPALFKEIQRQVKAGKWHVMGGWYLQPDCNMPSGESFVRQILLGRRWFREKFGVAARTAANLDSFGHTRGLVQILAKSGHDSYIFCRPGWHECPVPDTEFVWVGYDGSEIATALAAPHYNCPPGDGRRKIEEWMTKLAHKECSVIPWGVGNHGGGPSRRDLKDLAKLVSKRREAEVFHSTPEGFFKDLKRRKVSLPRHEGDLNPWAVGCYTTMARVKQKHRLLENELYMTEKMAATAAFQGLMDYPEFELRDATRDLMISEFHDALAGTSIPPVEESTVQLLDHGLETVSRVKIRAFFALASGQRKARDGEFPILVYNPHPFRVAAMVECELQPPWPHRTAQFAQPEVFHNGRRIAAQAEKAHCNINEDHRKRVVFSATLEPSRMNRFHCRLTMTARKPLPSLKERNHAIRFRTADLDVVINTRTGLVDRYRVRGVDYLDRNAFLPLVMLDDADPWAMRVTRFRTRAGKFRLMPRGAAARCSGIENNKLPSVRVIEDGPVRSVVEAVLAYKGSFICQRYKLPKRGTEIEVEVRAHWNEKDRMLKLSIPTLMPEASFPGQVAYGVAELPKNGDEVVAQKWVAAICRERDMAVTCINEGTYGADMAKGELRLSLLRSPAHSGHPTAEGLPIVLQDRYSPRIDQGERLFRFWLNAGALAERLRSVDREALVRNEKPFALTCYPSGEGKRPKPGPSLSDGAIQITTLKRAEDGRDLIIRLFEPTGRKRSTILSLPFVKARAKVTLSPFEIKTLRYKTRSRRFSEVDLLERPVRR